MSRTGKIMSAVVESWRACPLTHDRIPRLRGSISLAGTRTGPNGQNVEALLPLDHWPPDCSICRVRSETSLARAYPAIYAFASATQPRDGIRLPIMTASSTSQSVVVLPGGRVIESSGPTTVFGCLKNTIGRSGGLAPDSAAWAA